MAFFKALTTVLFALVLLPACAGSTAGTEFDRQFIDMMVPHHEGAVAMAEVARSRSQRPEILGMASAILKDQQGEIERMKGWRKAWYGSDTTPPMTRMPMVPGMAGGHGGAMDMNADVQKLRNAPEPFDIAFIDAMIPHHESAIEAARAAASRAQRAEIRQLAHEIIEAQQREIGTMRTWRSAWSRQ